MGPGWTPERTALLRQWWLDGWSAREIADHLGGVTRNAVIGKLFRLGVRRAAPTQPGSAAPKARARKAAAPPPQKVARPERRRSLGNGAGIDTVVGCRWIEGDPRSPDAMCCNAPLARGAPLKFCEHHLKRALHRDARRAPKP